MSSSPKDVPNTNQTSTNNQAPTNPPAEKQSPKDAAQNNQGEQAPCTKKKWISWALGSLVVVGALAGFAFIMKAKKHSH